MTRQRTHLALVCVVMSTAIGLVLVILAAPQIRFEYHMAMARRALAARDAKQQAPAALHEADSASTARPASLLPWLVRMNAHLAVSDWPNALTAIRQAREDATGNRSLARLEAELLEQIPAEVVTELASTEDWLRQINASWREAGLGSVELLQQARYFQSIGDLKTAKRWLARASKSVPQASEEWIARADAAIQLEDWDTAFLSLENVIVGGDHLRDAWFRVGQAYSASGRADRAISAYERALNSAGQSVGMSDVYYALGWVLAYGDTAPLDSDAEQAFVKAIEAGDFKVDPSARAEAYFQLGHTRYRSGALHGAMDAYERAVRTLPDRAAYRVALGVTLCRLEQCDQGERELQRAIALDPKQVDAYRALGRIYLERSDASRAREMLERVVVLDPSDVATRDTLDGLKP